MNLFSILRLREKPILTEINASKLTEWVYLFEKKKCLKKIGALIVCLSLENF